MPIHIFNFFLGQQRNSKQEQKKLNKSNCPKMHNKIKITQLGICKVIIEHNKKQSIWFLNKARK